MDIAALSMALNQSKVQQQVNVSLMNKTMDHANTASQGLIEMLNQSSVKAMEHSVAPHKGSSIDIKL